MVGAWKLKEGMALNVAMYMEAVWYLRGSGEFWVEGTTVNRDLWYIVNMFRNNVNRIPWLHGIANSNRDI